ncbi:MAG: type II toxin-antitoxin system VapC family toxin [Candidatus Brocadiaceae bacterium]|nr:type II toxin-antitoxin system VapC family toxin [Candidatus Brocadiaceae bacterium]
MLHKPKAIVLDSWSVIAYLGDEVSGEKVATLIADAHENNIPLMMTVITGGEVWYIITRRTSEVEADKSIAELHELGIEFVDADWRLTREAGRFKASRKMSFADCFAAALARQRKAHVVTGDREFRQVEHEVLMIWV